MLKLKYNFFALAIFMAAEIIFSGNVLAECKPGEERETNTGAVFTCDDSYPDLGEAWRDPRGLIWGDVVIVEDTDENPHYMNYAEATDYCISIGARLPSRAEFTALRQDMGAQSGTYRGYTAQILPNLSYLYAFWSSSVYPQDPTEAYYFHGYNGYIGYRARDFRDEVRCVVGR